MFPLRVGLIGYGHGGSVFHAPLVRATPGLSLDAIVTSNPERAARAALENPRARILPTADALWELSSSLDLIVVASPNRWHAPHASAALAHGLPVVVDKPFAATAADAQTLVDEASARGLMVTVFHNRRWDGDFLTVRDLMTRGDLGDIIRFESRFERWRPAPKGGWRERGDADEAGGLLYDLGSHLVDQALVLFGAVTHVYAELDRRRPGMQVDDDSFVALTHASGVRSHLWMSMLAAQPGPRIRMVGTRGTFVKYGLDLQEDAMRDGVAPSSSGFGQEPMHRWGSLSSGDGVRTVPTEAGAYLRFYEAVESSVRTGSAPPVDPRDAVRTLEIIETARRVRS